MDRSELIAEIKKQLQEELKDYKSSLEDKIPDEQKKQAKELKDSATTFIKENPWVSVGIAVLAGFVIARIAGQFDRKCRCTSRHGFCRRTAKPKKRETGSRTSELNKKGSQRLPFSNCRRKKSPGTF